MKIRISCKNGETSAEYSRLDDADAFRRQIFDFMLHDFGSAVLFINTNNGTGMMAKEDIRKTMDRTGASYIIEETEPATQTLLGFTMPSRRRKKNSENHVYIVIASIDDGMDTGLLFGGLLKYYDFALGKGEKRKPDDILPLARIGTDRVLFNKDVFENTYYDSVVVKRLRIDGIHTGLRDRLLEMKG